MILTKKRIRNINALRGVIKEGDKFTCGVKISNKFNEVLTKIGFSERLGAGESILPPSIFGPVSLYNAEGKFIVHKDKPKETAYRMAEWHWKEWHGPYDRVEQSKIVDVPYKRYPRTFVDPPSVEFTIFSTTNDERILIGPILEYNNANEQTIIHVVNLFLEIFGECQFFSENLDEIIKLPIKRLNWKILPPGQRP